MSSCVNGKALLSVSRIENLISQMMMGLIEKDTLSARSRQATYVQAGLHCLFRDLQANSELNDFTIDPIQFLADFKVTKRGQVLFRINSRKEAEHIVWPSYQSSIKGQRSRRLKRVLAKEFLGTYRIQFSLHIPGVPEPVIMTVTKESYRA